MKKPIITSTFFIVFALHTQAQEIKIGTQYWSAKNLDVTTFSNGDPIPEAKTTAEWLKAIDASKPAWCYYNNDPNNGKKYGKLYNWYAANDKRGLAPKGWHIPKPEEWDKLTNYLGGKTAAGAKMKSSSGWNDVNGKKGNGTNSSGFNGLPGGFRDTDGSFLNIGTECTWWCFWGGGGRIYSEDRRLGSDRSDVYVYGDFGSSGFSVRCIKD